MARDYKKENARSREKYRLINIKFPREFDERVRGYLARNGIELSEWVRKQLADAMDAEKDKPQAASF